MLTSRFPQIISKSAAMASRAVRHTEARIEFRAKEKSRWDTGNMRGGWQHQSQGTYEGIVLNLVEYTIFNEFGTIHMTAQPMLRPAIEESRQEFEREIRSAYV